METKVKICGLTCEKDVEYVLVAKPDYVGMVCFFSKSKRNISIERAKSLIKLLKASDESISVCAVTVSPEAWQVCDIIEAGFDHIQIHGEMKNEISQMDYPAGFTIIRAFNNVDEMTLKEIAASKDNKNIGYYLFDAAEPGSGKQFEWSSIPGLDVLCKPYFLAGGLNPDNVKYAVESIHPYAVDVSSGVECDVQPTPEEVQGGASMKDRDKILEFVANARGRSQATLFVLS